MQVSVETLKGLERKVMVSVPTEKIEEEVTIRLKKLSSKVKVDGFRPGKVPMSVVTKRFSDGVRQEVARDMVQSTLYDALKAEALVPAGAPTIEPEEIVAGQDFKYAAVFEVFPIIDIQELNQAKVEIVQSEVKDKDLNEMLDKLREQHKKWAGVSRAAAMGDKVVIDFEGFLEGKAFEGGAATNHELELGSDAMIPGFEAGLVGARQDNPLEITVTFPAEYGNQTLAGKETVFKITVKEILEGTLPELDDAFAEAFNVKEGGVEALKKEIKQNMERELARRVSSINRESVFDKLLEKNKFEPPIVLVDQEIAHLKHEMFHRLFGHEHSENEQIPDFPRSLFEEQAIRRVCLGLLFSEYVKKHEMVVDKVRVDAMIDSFASAYEDPTELYEWYRGNKERMAEIEALAMEEMVAEFIQKEAKVVTVKKPYDAVMNPKKDEDNKGE